MFIFLPIHLGSIPCSVARDAISEGVLNEALKASPKCLKNGPTPVKDACGITGVK